MSGKLKPIYYWDTSAFLAYLKDEREKHGDEAVDALSACASAFDCEQVVIATSVIGLGEVYSHEMETDLLAKFDEMRERPNFLLVGVTESIAIQAAHWRNHCIKATRGGDRVYRLAMPDALHVATANHVGAYVLWTLDAKPKKAEGARVIGMTQINDLPLPGLTKCVKISIPTLGLPGLGLF